MALGEVATRDFLRSELARLEPDRKPRKKAQRDPREDPAVVATEAESAS